MKPFLTLCLLVFGCSIFGSAQVRYYFENTSDLNDLSFGDDEIYLNFQLQSHLTTPAGAAATYDINTNSVRVIQGTPNTLLGPDGNNYQDINIRLNELPIDPGSGQYYIDMPPVFGSRLYVGFGAPVYRGYGNPLLETPGNPNYYNKVETIEFTIGQDGMIFTNTSRVDRYAYPMGEELYCGGALDSKVGETVTHEQVIAKWKLFVNDEFQNSYDPVRDVIMQMGHTPYFHSGPGHDYFEEFFDQLWAYASTHTMTAFFDGENHTITASGNTLFVDDAWFDRDLMHLSDFSGGSGQFGDQFEPPATTEQEKIDRDRRSRLRMAFGVSINRGVIQLTEEVQNWEDPQYYWQNPIKNDYTNFFHSDFVSHEGKTYALAFDDVFDQSSTQACPNPDKVIVYLGGFGTEHEQILSDVYITPLDLEVDQYKTLQLTANGLDQGLIDMDIPDDAIITWTLLDPSGNPANDLIDDNGLFGPTDVLGEYQVTLEVETIDGNTYTATEPLTVNPAGTTSEICTGEINGNMNFELEIIGTSVYLTLVPGPTWDNTAGYNRLFYGPNPALNEMGANNITPNDPFKFEGMYFGDEVYFQIHTEHNGASDGFIHIPNLGTCDGLSVLEVIVNLETPLAVTIADDETYQIIVDGITNYDNTVTYPDDLFVEDLEFDGEGVDENGLFTPDGPGEYTVTITYDDILITTVITVTGDACSADIELEDASPICPNTDLSIALPSSETYTDVEWSGNGATFIDNSSASSIVFNADESGTYTLDVTAIDGSGCDASGSMEIEVTATDSESYDVTLASSLTEICPNDVIELTSSIDPGASNPTYNWTVGGENIAIDQNSLSVDTLTQTAEVIITVNYETTCGAGISRDTIEIQVNDPAQPSVALEIDADICPGDPLTITALPTNGGAAPVYSWEIDGISSIESAASWTTTTLPDGAEISVVMTSSLSCANGANASANGTVELKQNVDLDAEFSVNKNSICSSENVTAEVVISGTPPSDIAYAWQINAIDISNTASILSVDTLTRNALVEVSVSYDAGCSTETLDFESSIEVTSAASPMVAIELTDGTCEGEAITIQATELQGVNTPEFTWMVNGAANGETAQSWASSTLADGDEISVEMTTDLTCATQPTATASKIITLLPTVEYGLKWSAVTDTVCTDEPLNLTVSASNAGNNPNYTWSVAGVDVNNNSNALTEQTITSTSTIAVTLTPDVVCPNVAQVMIDTTIVVRSGTPPSLTLTASADEVCEGDTVHFSVESHAGIGASPTFTWLMNGELLAETGAFFSSTMLEMSTIVVSAESQDICHLDDEASDDVTISVSDLKSPIIEALPSEMEVCADRPLNVGFPGGTDVENGTINWLHNGMVASTSASFSTSSWIDGDIIAVQVLTTHQCQADSIVQSNEMSIIAKDCSIPDTIIAPNTITPNGDGHNDTWIIQYLDDFREHTVMIFGRNGRLVFESDDYQHDWGGEWQQNNRELPETTYYYIIDVPELDEQYKGTITILRE